MERIKLVDPGSELTLAVANVTQEELGGGKYYKCDDGKTEILVPTSAADRQFERIGITSAGGMVGKTIKFSRSDNISKSGHPFWNLDLATGAKPNGKTVGAALTPNSGNYTPPQFRDDLPDELREQDEYETETVKTIQNGGVPKMPMRQAYKAITEWTLKEIAPLYEKAGIGLSPEAAAAITATVWIEANRRDLIA